MRTTVTIDDDVYREAKAAAAKSGRPVGALIEDALRLVLGPGEHTDELPPFRQFSGTGLQPGVNIDSNAELQDLFDEGVPLDALR